MLACRGFTSGGKISRFPSGSFVQRSCYFGLYLQARTTSSYWFVNSHYKPLPPPRLISSIFTDQIRATSDDIELQTSCYFSSGPPSRGPQVANTSPLIESRPGHATAALNGSFPGRGKGVEQFDNGNGEAGVDNWINLKPWMDQVSSLAYCYRRVCVLVD